jgi:cytochrome c oxidase subunit 2
MQSALSPAGPQAELIANSFWIFVGVSTFVFVIVVAFALMAVYRKRQTSEDQTPEFISNPMTEQRLTKAVSIAVGLTVLILFALLVMDFFENRALYTLNDKQPLVIAVTGYQWWWEVKYWDKDPSKIVTTANEIHVPTGKAVQFRLNAHDVIHSFWTPNFNGKKDLIPGHPTTIWYKADRPGTYRGQCAEFCGHQHAHMRFVLVAEPPDQFLKWLNHQRKPAAPPENANQERGQQVFLNNPCIMCHAISGTPAQAAFGPNLTHVGSEKMIAAGTLPNTRDHLLAWIHDPQSIKPGTKMPQNPLSRQDLYALVDYLQNLK